jgi:hypothetical protein
LDSIRNMSARVYSGGENEGSLSFPKSVFNWSPNQRRRGPSRRKARGGDPKQGTAWWVSRCEIISGIASVSTQPSISFITCQPRPKPLGPPRQQILSNPVGKNSPKRLNLAVVGVGVPVRRHDFATNKETSGSPFDKLVESNSHP